MNRQRRQAWLVGLLLLMLLIAAAWSVGGMFEQRAQARQAMADLHECQTLAAEIKALRKQPTVASNQAMGVQELGDHINASQKKAGLDSSIIDGVFPQSERRLGDTVYQVKPTALTLRQVALPKLAVFLYHLTEGTGLRLRDLQLRVP
ncbi:MAG: hypothetical protein GVY24_05065, partial [Planctomycetes bacterium]|nr:hypothetical protein [Planctomycetota bacterium]